MKKKLLAGLLTVSACFSIGSTSFASSVTPSQVAKVSESEASIITPSSIFEATIKMKVGESIYVTGYSFWFVHDGHAVDYTQEGLFVALNPGTSIIAANFGNGNTMHYTVIVE
ncbi:hypothetical protein [Paenibacillus sp. FSL R10-2734]|uniref:hypothetical protein n=1 Tax=Paenibacillus sp. FSL R10-2734 TaxID=2954691 RepID=UPI0030DC8B86